jgi:Pyruvate phosphate dikinase, AMP/ATP-binding domain
MKIDDANLFNSGPKKYIYAFEEGDGKNKILLGGKGAGLCEMTRIGLNVPPGFTVTTEACLAYLETNHLPDGLMDDIKVHMAALCPSCNTRRMVETAAHLSDHVLPPLPLRQWVLAVPKRLRYFLHDDAVLQGVVVRILLRAIERCLREHSPGSSAAARLRAVGRTEMAILRCRMLRHADRLMPTCRVPATQSPA